VPASNGYRVADFVELICRVNSRNKQRPEPDTERTLRCCIEIARAFFSGRGNNGNPRCRPVPILLHAR
jgi:hypothetical protein